MKARTGALGGVSAQQRRKCIVKLSYKNQGSKKSERLKANRLYLQYICRESATLKDKPVWEDAIKGKEFYTIMPGGRKVMMTQEEVEKKLGTDQTFRIILSPEDSSIDLDQLVQKFMYSSFYGVNGLGERSIGFVACNHYNTAHPHAHILVSRKSEKNHREDELRVPPSYVKFLAREEAGFICSCIGGPRTKREYMEGERKIIERRGLCTYDYLICNAQKKEMKTTELKKEEFSHFYVTDAELDKIDPRKRKSVRRRLNFLCLHFPDFVHRKLNGSYILQKGWTKQLETCDYLKIAGLEGKTDNKKVIIDNGPKQEKFKAYSGTVKGVAVLDDYEEKVLLTIEDKEGQTHVLAQKMNLDKMNKINGAEVDVKKTGRRASITSRALL